MKIYHILIIENKNASITHLKKCLIDIGHRIVGVANNAPQAVRLHRKVQADLAIIGINQSNITDNLQLGTYFKNEQFPFLYLTYSLDKRTLAAANRTRPCGYLNRPCRIDDLRATISMSMHTFNQTTTSNTTHQISLNYKSGTIRIDDILFVQAEHVYTRIFLKNGQSILQRQSLKTIVSQLPKDNFVQSHRSYVVQLQMVDHISSDLIYIRHHRIPVSRNRRKIVQQYLQNRHAARC